MSAPPPVAASSPAAASPALAYAMPAPAYGTPACGAFAPGAPSRVPFGALLAGDRGPRLASALAYVPPGLPVAHASACSPGHATASSSPRPSSSRDDDPLDPLHRHRAAIGGPEGFFAPAIAAPPAPLPPPPAPAPTVRAPLSLEDLLPAFVRRIAWSSDGKRATARLEIGAGELAGATLLVHADAGRVRVQLDVPRGVDAGAWQARIRQRFEERRIAADAIEVA